MTAPHLTDPDRLADRFNGDEAKSIHRRRVFEQHPGWCVTAAVGLGGVILGALVQSAAGQAAAREPPHGTPRA